MKRAKSHKRPRAADEPKAAARTLRASPTKRACPVIRRAYETPSPDVDAFDMLPIEIVREIMMRIDEWRDVVALQATAQRFVGVLSPCDTWVRKYAPDMPFDLTAVSPGACPEPLEAFVAVHARWGMRARGFDPAGMVRLAAAGRTDALMWLNGVYGTAKRAKAQARQTHWPAWVPSDGGADYSLFRYRQDQAQAAVAAGHADTLDAILGNDPNMIVQCGFALMVHAVASNRTDLVDVVHRYMGASGRRHERCGSGLRAALPATESCEPMTVFDHLLSVGCPTAVNISSRSLGSALTNGTMGLVAWLHKQTRVPQDRCTRRNVDDAASRGHFAAVRWAHERGVRRCALSTLVAGVASRAPGTLDFVRWALDQEDGERRHGARVPEWRDGLLAVQAARAGAVEVVRWLYENHPEMVTMQAARAAATACRADVAIYLNEVGVAPFGAYRPLRRVIVRLHDPDSSRPMPGHVVEALDALAAAGAPYDDKVLEEATTGSHGPVLGVIAKHYCRDGDSPLSTPSQASLSATDQWPWPKAPCIPPTLDDIMRAAVRGDCLDTIRWVKNNIPGTRLCLAIEMMRAAGEKHTRINALGKCLCPTCKPARS